MVSWELVNLHHFRVIRIDNPFQTGFSTIAKSGAKTFMENLVDNNALTSNLFSFYLQRAADVSNSSSGTISGGELCIGCTDSSKYTGTIGELNLPA